MLEKIAEQIEQNLINSDAGLQVEFRPGYFAYATETGEGYQISYHRGEGTPAYSVESFDDASGCVREMVKISTGWKEIEIEESRTDGPARARMEELGFDDDQLDFIFADWPNMDEHLDWLMTASKEEITDWIEAAKQFFIPSRPG